MSEPINPARPDDQAPGDPTVPPPPFQTPSGRRPPAGYLPFTPSPRPGRPWPWLLALVGVGALAVVAAVLVLSGGSGGPKPHPAGPVGSLPSASRPAAPSTATSPHTPTRTTSASAGKDHTRDLLPRRLRAPRRWQVITMRRSRGTISGVYRGASRASYDRWVARLRHAGWRTDRFAGALGPVSFHLARHRRRFVGDWERRGGSVVVVYDAHARRHGSR